MQATEGDVTLGDSQRRFLAQHSVATLLGHCVEWLQHCSNIAALCYAKNRCCESSCVTSPLEVKLSYPGSRSFFSRATIECNEDASGSAAEEAAGKSFSGGSL